MHDSNTTIADMRTMVREFVVARNWESFHTPKNLAMALSIEAAEIMEHFQWLTADESNALSADQQRRDAVAEELCDVLAYLLSLANALDVDVASAFVKKMQKNSLKYPAPNGD
jgi:NTP pyrophosphatase (non-canonical NTP hydrolase)